MANNSNPNNNQILPLEKLSEIPLDCLKINCNNYIQKILGENIYCVELFIYCPDLSLFNNYCSNRNYSEFKELFENFTKKNPTETLPEFPSRYTFLKHYEEARIKYFDMFLNKILELCKDESKKEENLQLLYNFFFGYQDASINKIPLEKLKEKFNVNLNDSTSEEEDNKSVKSDLENRTKIINKKIIKNFSSDKLPTYNKNSSFMDDKDSKDSNSVNNDDIRSTDSNKNFNSIRRYTLNLFNGIKKSITNEDKYNL